MRPNVIVVLPRVKIVFPKFETCYKCWCWQRNGTIIFKAGPIRVKRKVEPVNWFVVIKRLTIINTTRCWAITRVFNLKTRYGGKYLTPYRYIYINIGYARHFSAKISFIIGGVPKILQWGEGGSRLIYNFSYWKRRHSIIDLPPKPTNSSLKIWKSLSISVVLQFSWSDGGRGLTSILLPRYCFLFISYYKLIYWKKKKKEWNTHVFIPARHAHHTHLYETWTMENWVHGRKINNKKLYKKKYGETLFF